MSKKLGWNDISIFKTGPRRDQSKESRSITIIIILIMGSLGKIV